MKGFARSWKNFRIFNAIFRGDCFRLVIKLYGWVDEPRVILSFARCGSRAIFLRENTI